MTPKEIDDWNLRINKPLICWSVEKPGRMFIRDDALWAIAAMCSLAIAAPIALAIVIGLVGR